MSIEIGSYWIYGRCEMGSGKEMDGVTAPFDRLRDHPFDRLRDHPFDRLRDRTHR